MQIIHVLMTGMEVRSAAFSTDGNSLAVGSSQGGVKVFSFYPKLEQVHWRKPFSSAVDCLAYNPAGSLLAAAAHE